MLAILDQPRTDAQRDEMEAHGRRLFLRNSCHNCHGTELNGNVNIAPRLRGLYDAPARLIDGVEVTRDPAYLARSILRPQEQVITGYSQPMSSYGHLPAAEVAALIAYLHRYSPPPQSSDGNTSASAASGGQRPADPADAASTARNRQHRFQARPPHRPINLMRGRQRRTSSRRHGGTAIATIKDRARSCFSRLKPAAANVGQPASLIFRPGRAL